MWYTECSGSRSCKMNVSIRRGYTTENCRAIWRFASRHASSKYHRRHLLDVANFYARMAEEYTQANPPESLRFDPVVFQELVEAAMQIYQTVAAEDGSPEKLEAGRRLEAFLAFTLQVDRDRFTK